MACVELGTSAGPLTDRPLVFMPTVTVVDMRLALARFTSSWVDLTSLFLNWELGVERGWRDLTRQLWEALDLDVGHSVVILLGFDGLVDVEVGSREVIR